MKIPNPVPPSRAARDRKSKWLLGLSGLGALVLIVAAIGTGWLAREWNPQLDKQLCPVDRPVPAESVIIIDATDEWNPTQRLAVEQIFRQLHEQVPRFGRVHLFSVHSARAELATPLLTLCNPGQPEDFEEFPLVGELGAAVVANPADLAQTWERSYVDSLARVFERESASGARAASPIMETIRSAALTVFASSPAERRSLIIFSDLLQNSGTYSLYEDPTWTVDDGRTAADFGAFGTGSLADVSVELYLLDREVVGATPGHLRSALVQLWDTFFTEQEAYVTRVRRIEG